MGLLVSRVPRSLEARTKVLGFDLGDLLLIFLYLSLANFLFGGTSLRVPLVWGVTAILGATLYVAKRNRPDNFLQHLLQFYLVPAVLSALKPDVAFRPCPLSSDGGNNGR